MFVIFTRNVLLYYWLTTSVANAFVPDKFLLDVSVLKRYDSPCCRRRCQITAPRTPPVSLSERFSGNDGGDESTNNPPPVIVDDPTARLTIPVLGPIPNRGPLLPGAELTLDPPTPWQWQLIQEAVRQHARYLQCVDDENNQGTIDAAPLVAVMDQDSSRTTRSGRYATLAAVVGMTSTLGGTVTGMHQQRLDLSDTSSFSESLQSITRQGVSPWESKIRLVGVGRALVKDFFYRIPADTSEGDEDDEGHVRKVARSVVLENIQYKDGEEDDDDDMIDEDRLNLVMAHFVVLTDCLSGTRTDTLLGRHASPSIRKSPVHALTDMATWAGKLEFLHQTSRRLVAGLQAATARLKLVQRRQQQSYSPEEEAGGVNNFFDSGILEEDHDGLGMLTASRYDMNLDDEDRFGAQSAVEDILQFLPATKEEESDNGDVNVSPLYDMENYGMGYSSTSFTTIPMVTKVWLEKLEPFYSPEIRDTEEYYYEILSFVVILAMDKYLTNRDLAWALVCCNTIERMQRAYEWMFHHVLLLEQEATRMSAQLRDCGEECTDLW